MKDSRLSPFLKRLDKLEMEKSLYWKITYEKSKTEEDVVEVNAMHSESGG